MKIHPNTEEEYEQPIDFIAFFYKYISYWKWFLASSLICIGMSIIFLKLAIPSYQVSATILLKDDQKGGGVPELNLLKDIGIINNKNNVENELDILKTSTLIEQVICELGLYVSYSQSKTFKSEQLYDAESPLKVSLNNKELYKLTQNIKLKVVMHPDGTCEFSGEHQGKEFKTIKAKDSHEATLPFGTIQFKKEYLKLEKDFTVNIEIQNPTKVSYSFLSNMNLELTSKNTSIVNITLTTNHLQLGKDFLNKLIEIYNRQDVNEQNMMSSKTANFIDNRLFTLTKELNDVESKVESYKQNQGITDIHSEANLFIQQTGSYEQKILDVETQLALISDIHEYINKKDNLNQMLPASTGLKSDGINDLINNYNKLLLDRNRLSRIASNSNTAMLSLNSQIESLFSHVKKSVLNEKKNLQNQKKDLVNKESQNAVRIKAIPRQEKEYTEIKRQQNIKEALFLFLLQKKEENYLRTSMIEPKCKIIDKARSSGQPTSPKPTIILILSSIFGFIMPVFGIKIHDLLRFQVDNKSELEKITIVPILGEIPRSFQTGNIIIKENNTDSFTEMVRLLRTNLLFILGDPEKKIITILSSIGGEGKTFVTINLAMSLALLNKKVLIIGLDVRKPKLGEYIGLDNELGLTLYLSGNMEKSKLIRPSGIHQNLSIITAGPVPPNPNELISKPTLDKLIDELRNQFDFIIIDTSPISLVSDSFIINRFSDVSLFIVRADYTHKKHIEDATLLYNSKKIKNMYILK